MSEKSGQLVVFTPAGGVSVELSEGLSQMAHTSMSPLTIAPYARGALKFLTYRFKLTQAATFDSLLPLENIIRLRFCFRDFLTCLGAKVSPSRTEEDVWHVDAPPERNTELTQIICGTFHLFEGLVYAKRLEANPFAIPFDKRRARRLPTPSQTTAGPVITPRFRFRIPASTASALRTDSSVHVHQIVPALMNFGAPPSIVAMIQTMVEGLARISEQRAATVWDWWEPSQFGSEMAMTDKGDGKHRVKVQVFSPEHVGELLLFFDGPRRTVDLQGWGLDEWRNYLADDRISPRERRAHALAVPLFPNGKGGFYSRSGIIDCWYAPAMRKAGLPTRTHYIRHAGVNDFLSYIDAQTHLTNDQKDVARLEFAKGMGWKWPEVMLAHYSLPQRRFAAFEVRRNWISNRAKPKQLLAAGLGRPPVNLVPPSASDRQLSRLVKFRLTAGMQS